MDNNVEETTPAVSAEETTANTARVCEDILSYEVSNASVEDMTDAEVRAEIAILRNKVILFKQTVRDLQSQLKASNEAQAAKPKREPIPVLASNGANLSHVTKSRPTRARRSPSAAGMTASVAAKASAEVSAASASSKTEDQAASQSSASTSASAATAQERVLAKSAALGASRPTAESSSSSTKNDESAAKSKDDKPASLSAAPSSAVFANMAAGAKLRSTQTADNTPRASTTFAKKQETLSNATEETKEESIEEQSSVRPSLHGKESSSSSVNGFRKPVGGMGFGMPSADLTAALNRRNNNSSFTEESASNSVASSTRPSVLKQTPGPFGSSVGSSSERSSVAPAPLGAKLGAKVATSDSSVQPADASSATAQASSDDKEPSKKKFGFFGRSKASASTTTTNDTKNSSANDDSAASKDTVAPLAKPAPVLAPKPASGPPTNGPPATMPRKPSVTSPASARASVASTQTNNGPAPILAPKPSSFAAPPVGAASDEDLAAWIGGKIGDSISSPLQDALKDGSVLGKLAMAVKPGSAKFNPSKFKFAQIENVSAYLRVANEIGVTSPPFDPKDPIESENWNTIKNHLTSFKAAC